MLDFKFIVTHSESLFWNDVTLYELFIKLLVKGNLRSKFYFSFLYLEWFTCGFWLIDHNLNVICQTSELHCYVNRIRVLFLFTNNIQKYKKKNCHSFDNITLIVAKRIICSMCSMIILHISTKASSIQPKLSWIEHIS